MQTNLPAAFDEPDRLDITHGPNNHLAFSKGNHFCLGAHLARMKTKIAPTNLFDLPSPSSSERRTTTSNVVKRSSRRSALAGADRRPAEMD